MNPSTLAASFVFNTSQNLSVSNGAMCRLADLMEFFFIAHPESGRKEGEESERILYFDSKSETPDKQTQITGFAEAVVNFTGNFVNDEEESECEFPFRYVNTTKQLHVYILVESASFIIGMAMNKTLCSMQEYTLHAPTIKSVLTTAYCMFRLFFGSFSKLFLVDRQQLKDRFKYFFSRYLSLLRLYQMPLVDLFRGVDFLPLGSINYLRVENLIGQLTERFPQIAKTMFLYQERLLSYSVPKSDLSVLFQYLTQNLLHMSLRAELQPEQKPGRHDSSSHHHGKFLTGATDVSVETMIANARDVKFPVIYLSEDEDHDLLTPYQLIVYRALNATICLFLRRDAEAAFLRDLDTMLGPELSAIASHIGDSYVTPTNGLSAETDFHFIYYNPASLSLKTSFYEPTGETTKAPSPPAMPVNVYKLACDMIDEFLEDEEFGEVIVKSEPDWWISGKRTNGRLLLLLVHNPNFVSLADVQQHVHTIIKTHFDAIFLT